MNTDKEIGVRAIVSNVEKLKAGFENLKPRQLTVTRNGDGTYCIDGFPDALWLPAAFALSNESARLSERVIATQMRHVSAVLNYCADLDPGRSVAESSVPTTERN